MAKFSDIIGQEKIKEQLKSAIINNTVSHAYIINGEKDSGKEFIANTFAMALQCQGDGVEPCMECHSCKQAITNNHPDIYMVTHEKPNTIGVADIRNQVVNDVVIKPYNGKKKIYIINDAEKMTVQAQNTLLKTLEEPPEYTVILLLTSNVSSLLPTIISRSVVLNMKPVEDKVIRKYLMEIIRVPDYQADICVAFARGNVGKAKHLATSEDFEKIKNEAISVLKNIHDCDMDDFILSVKNINAYKVNIDDYLDLITIWYRDILMYKAVGDGSNLIFRDELRTIKEKSNQSTYEGIERVLEGIKKTKDRLNANVNFELAMELLLLTIKEN